MQGLSEIDFLSSKIGRCGKEYCETKAIRISCVDLSISLLVERRDIIRLECRISDRLISRYSSFCTIALSDVLEYEEKNRRLTLVR